MNLEKYTLKSKYLPLDKRKVALTMKKRVKIPLPVFWHVQHNWETGYETDFSKMKKIENFRTFALMWGSVLGVRGGGVQMSVVS